MTNKELLKSILNSRVITIQFLDNKDILNIIYYLKKIYNVRANGNSDWNGVKDIFNSYDALFFDVNTRTIRKGILDAFKFNDIISYKLFNSLCNLMDWNCDLEQLMKDIKDE